MRASHRRDRPNPDGLAGWKHRRFPGKIKRITKAEALGLCFFSAFYRWGLFSSVLPSAPQRRPTLQRASGLPTATYWCCRRFRGSLVRGRRVCVGWAVSPVAATMVSFLAISLVSASSAKHLPQASQYQYSIVAFFGSGRRFGLHPLRLMGAALITVSSSVISFVSSLSAKILPQSLALHCQ